MYEMVLGKRNVSITDLPVCTINFINRVIDIISTHCLNFAYNLLSTFKHFQHISADFELAKLVQVKFLAPNLAGVMIGQNYAQLSDATLNNFFFRKFILSKIM